MAKLGFTGGRIDQTHQGSVSNPAYRNLVLTTIFFVSSYDAGINTFDTANVR
jgi:hypothetical protein